MKTNQTRVFNRGITLYFYFLLIILLSISCKNNGVGLHNAEEVKPDTVNQNMPDTVWIIGRGGVYYNDDIVSTPPKEIVYSFTKYNARIGTLLYPDNALFTIGVMGYYPWLKFRASPDNHTPFRVNVDLGSMHPITQKREYVANFVFFTPVNEEFTLTPTLTIPELDSSVTRSTKIKIEVVERNVDVLHSSFGMSRQDVRKSEKDELNVDASNFLEISPELILKDDVIDSDTGFLNLVAFNFKNDKLTSIIAIHKSGADLSVVSDLARDYGSNTALSGSNQVKWQKNGLQFTAQMKELLIRPEEKKTVPCITIEKIP